MGECILFLERKGMHGVEGVHNFCVGRGRSDKCVWERYKVNGVCGHGVRGQGRIVFSQRVVFQVWQGGGMHFLCHVTAPH